jgi:hypothetical protein
VGDAYWLATLARTGLLRGSFVPPAKWREWRWVARQRQKLVSQLTAEKDRLHKVAASRLRAFSRLRPQKLAHFAFQYFLQRLFHQRLDQITFTCHRFRCKQLRITLLRGHGLPFQWVQGRSRQSTSYHDHSTAFYC